MKVTPLEIRQKSFERVFRGCDKEEVEAYLLSLSQEWERLLDKNKELNMKLENAHKELEKLHEVESSLFKTLKTAEDTGQNILNQANQKATLTLKEAFMEAEKGLRDSKIKSEDILMKAESEAESIISKAENESREILDEMLGQIKDMEYHYRELEDTKQNLNQELKRITSQINIKISDTETNTTKYRTKIDDLVQKAKKTLRKAQEKSSVKKDIQKMAIDKDQMSGSKYSEEEYIFDTPYNNEQLNSTYNHQQTKELPFSSPEPKQEVDQRKSNSFFDEID